jgi:hypothetical protein
VEGDEYITRGYITYVSRTTERSDYGDYMTVFLEAACDPRR